jgi:hypothetical protein
LAAAGAARIRIGYYDDGRLNRGVVAALVLPVIAAPLGFFLR